MSKFKEQKSVMKNNNSEWENIYFEKIKVKVKVNSSKTIFMLIYKFLSN